MKKIKQGLDNLCFDKNENLERAEEALNSVLRKEEFWFVITGCTAGFNKDNGDVLFFFPIDELSRSSNETKEKFLLNLIKAWKSVGFEIIEQTELNEHIYTHVGFNSLFFKLRSCI